MKASFRKMIDAAVFCAVMAACAQLVLPMPAGVPMTLQTLAVALCGYCLHWKYALAAVGTYLLLGGIGLPIFSGFGGGFGWLFGAGGGFLLGFLLLAVGCGLPLKKRWLAVVAGMAALLLCHGCGVAWYAYVTNQSIRQAALVASLPYLGKDLLCIWLAELIANKIGFFKKRY